MKYYAHFDWSRECWEVRSRARGGGDRRIAMRLSERYARRIVRLLNEDEDEGREVVS